MDSLTPLTFYSCHALSINHIHRKWMDWRGQNGSRKRSGDSGEPVGGDCRLSSVFPLFLHTVLIASYITPVHLCTFLHLHPPPTSPLLIGSIKRLFFVCFFWTFCGSLAACHLSGSSEPPHPCIGVPGPSEPAPAPAMSAKNAAAGGGDRAGSEPGGN